MGFIQNLKYSSWRKTRAACVNHFQSRIKALLSRFVYSYRVVPIQCVEELQALGLTIVSISVFNKCLFILDRLCRRGFAVLQCRFYRAQSLHNPLKLLYYQYSFVCSQKIYYHPRIVQLSHRSDFIPLSVSFFSVGGQDRNGLSAALLP